VPDLDDVSGLSAQRRTVQQPTPAVYRNDPELPSPEREPPVSSSPPSSSAPGTRRIDDVFVLTLGDGENRLTPRFLDELEACVADVLATTAPRALVTSGRHS
jgi:hypothetical protein